MTRTTPLSLSIAALTPRRVTSTMLLSCWRYFQPSSPIRLLRAPSSSRLPGMLVRSRVAKGSVIASAREPATSKVLSLAPCSGFGHSSSPT
ncbi:MAG: hypothetical protein IPO88_22100 [Nannocystis sp.]|uniref:hypothetical protein n=1 Tax=Nannocystis sp. TaxID=1962667 RepID=UPI002427305B|nr:hypothetical protein [Nannocystis sp.]MBK9756135.1 hypothetical protein [Nannocystis sp.]